MTTENSLDQRSVAVNLQVLVVVRPQSICIRFDGMAGDLTGFIGQARGVDLLQVPTDWVARQGWRGSKPGREMLVGEFFKGKSICYYSGTWI